jgi:SAM-dependent methyltransferase
MNKNPDAVHDIVRERYAQRAKTGSCCGPADPCDLSSDQLYPVELLKELPEDVSSFSLGCGNPIDIARLKQGETVLDLGSGGGLDCFFASRKVGESGHVIGVDMTPEMIDRARSNAERLRLSNVEFRHGYLEDLPLEDTSVDVVISNCVINLTPDKFKVFAEIGRVLRSGGRLAISDVVSNGPVPQAMRDDVESWGACLGGALEYSEFERGLRAAGFTEIVIQPKEDAGRLPSTMPVGMPFSAHITARKGPADTA